MDTTRRTAADLEADVDEEARRANENITEHGEVSAGDPVQVPPNSHVSMPGTSETSPPLQGVRTPRR